MPTFYLFEPDRLDTFLKLMKDDSTGRSQSSKEYRTKSYIKDDRRAKARRSSRCLSFVEIPIDPSAKSLKHLDSQKLKDGIRKWARAVVAYARQVSQHFASPKSRRSPAECDRAHSTR